MELRKKNFNIMGVHWKIQFLVGAHEKTIYRGELPKVRGGGGGRRRGGGGVDNPLWIMFVKNLWKKLY